MEEKKELVKSSVINVTIKSYSKQVGKNKCNLSLFENIDKINENGETVQSNNVYLFDSQINNALSNLTPYAMYFKNLNSIKKHLLLWKVKAKLEIINYPALKDDEIFQFEDSNGVVRTIEKADNCGTSIRLISIDLDKEKIKELEKECNEYLEKQSNMSAELETQMLLGLKKREE